MKKILGLDLGTNSIGWAVVSEDNGSTPKIEAAGSRIIPMTADQIGDFEKGNTVSQTQTRTSLRGNRRLRERFILRRERLLKILKKMDFLPEHYAQQIGQHGKFIKNSEPKIEWKKNDTGNYVFLFQESFLEMLSLFQLQHPELKNKRIPADWTLYFLRKKALKEKISKEEISWILLNFNQKRGYYQLRGEDDDIDQSKREEYMKLIVDKVEETGDKKGSSMWYNIHLSNGLIYKRTSDKPLDWVGKEKEFIVTTLLEKDGRIKKDKEGRPRISIRLPQEDDWNLVKKRTESEIENSTKTVGEYIFDNILKNPDLKVIGKLVRTIERKYYKAELRKIILKQAEFHPELEDKMLYQECINLLYPNNISYRNSISQKGFPYLLCEDIIFYQRPLKSKKHLISNCPYESRKYINKDTGEIFSTPIKCIPKSHPLFQEFRLWQFINNLRIYRNDGITIDVTEQYLPKSKWGDLFDWLNDRKEIDQKTFLTGFLGLKKSNDNIQLRWNYVEDKKYPCNRTKSAIHAKLQKEEYSRITNEILQKIWHLLYSVKVKEEIDAVFSENKIGQGGIYDELRTILSSETIQKLKNIQFEEDDYASYSEKAIKRLLPLMRAGKSWNYEAIDASSQTNIHKLLNQEFDPILTKKIRNYSEKLSTREDFQGLPVWLACYLVYGKHSEGKECKKWHNPQDITSFLESFRQHSMNNPIVEQIITETLRTVRDIWTKVGQLDEIHIELGRDLKNSKEQRERISKLISENENRNQRIRTLLQEFACPDFSIDNNPIEEVRPYSPYQQELFKIYEDTVLLNRREKEDDWVNEILNKLNSTDVRKQPTRTEVQRYALWLNQKYQSPYTGKMIPLTKLFTKEYEIEHIIPKSRFFDDSFHNKVICEAPVNKLKDNSLGMEFIENHGGSIVETTHGTVTVLTKDCYEKLVRRIFANDHKKKERLLMTDIPDKFIERQINDTRYISKYVLSLLSNVVREEISPGQYEEESTSKHVIACSGKVTDFLKKDWGMPSVWNQLMLPRFERLNKICQTNQFTKEINNRLCPNVPDNLRRGFSIKRIDHRHHAMDAIVIACTSREHVNLINNEAARSCNSKEHRQNLSRKLRNYELENINGVQRAVAKEFKKPWPTFTEDVKDQLERIIISYKQNLRIINKAYNKYVSYYDENGNLRTDRTGNPVKGLTQQQNHPDWWAIRKSMHKDTVFGKVALRKTKDVRLEIALSNPDAIVNKELKAEIKRLLSLGYNKKGIEQFFTQGENKDIWQDFNTKKIAIYYFTEDTFATRKPLSKEFDKNKIEKSVTDTGIQKILLRHLKENADNPEIAFSPDGIEQMNQNIIHFNDGKFHKPIYSVRVYEAGSKFPIGKDGNKKDKYVEADKGTNLYFGIYMDQNGIRSFETIALHEAIERMKKGLSPVPQVSEKGSNLLFFLSPNDLVYVPTIQEIRNQTISYPIDVNRIYKMVSCSGAQCFFNAGNIAKPIYDKIEFSSLNKMEKTIHGEMIKSICIPIKVDRLGNINAIQEDYFPNFEEE